MDDLNAVENLLSGLSGATAAALYTVVILIAIVAVISIITNIWLSVVHANLTTRRISGTKVMSAAIAFILLMFLFLMKRIR